MYQFCCLSKRSSRFGIVVGYEHVVLVITKSKVFHLNKELITCEQRGEMAPYL